MVVAIEAVVFPPVIDSNSNQDTRAIKAQPKHQQNHP
jgi:hypothetical protein